MTLLKAQIEENKALLNRSWLFLKLDAFLTPVS